MGRRPKPKEETVNEQPTPTPAAALPENPDLVAQLTSDTTTPQPESIETSGKKTPGRPRKEKAEQPAQETIVPTMPDPVYTGMIMAVGMMVTSRACPTMPITQDEAERLSLPMTQIMAYIAPQVLPVHMACIHLTFATLGIVVPRVFEASRLAEEAKKKPVHNTPTMPDSTSKENIAEAEIS